MPCTTGRASHQLCKLDCPKDACSCQPVSSFSCRPFCFCEEMGDNTVQNQQKSLADARTDFCTVIDGANPTVYTTVGEFETFICGLTGTLPYFNCPFEISIEGAPDVPGATGPTGLLGPYAVATVDKRVCTVAGNGAQALETGTNVFYDVLIDGVACDIPFENI